MRMWQCSCSAEAQKLLLFSGLLQTGLTLTEGQALAQGIDTGLYCLFSLSSGPHLGASCQQCCPLLHTHQAGVVARGWGPWGQVSAQPITVQFPGQGQRSAQSRAVVKTQSLVGAVARSWCLRGPWVTDVSSAA